MTKPNIIVIGDLMLDQYWSGSTERVSPEAPVPVMQVKIQKNCVGGAGNVAMNIAAQGVNCYLVGSVGRDEAGQYLARMCEEVGIQTRFIQLPNIQTTVKLRAICQSHQLLRLDFEEKTPIAFEDIKAQISGIVDMADIIVLSDYSKGMLHDVSLLIQYIRAHNVPVIVDPKRIEMADYCGADILTPNFQEFEGAVGRKIEGEADLIESGKKLRERLELQALLVTRGENGITGITEKGAFTMPAVAKEVYDVTGAGDTVVAILATQLARQQSLQEAVAMANRAAAIAVSKVGTATVSKQELETTEISQRKILSLRELLVEREQFSLKGKSVVMTNGCFDILHPGHIKVLQESRRLGDVLIVAVNEDDSIKRLKGANRPIHPLWHRQTVLAALECVDFVVSFSEDTPLSVITALVPDVYTKGGDYQKQEIVGAEIVEKNGGRVVTIPLVPECATTRTVTIIQQQSVVET